VSSQTTQSDTIQDKVFAVPKLNQTEVEASRRNADRRDGDRRQEESSVAIERRQVPRRKVQRRRQIDPTTCERDYTDDEVEFMQVLDTYKRTSGRMFPTCSEILEVIRGMGYVRVATPTATMQTADGVTEPTIATEAAALV